MKRHCSYCVEPEKGLRVARWLSSSGAFASECRGSRTARSLFSDPFPTRATTTRLFAISHAYRTATLEADETVQMFEEKELPDGAIRRWLQGQW